VDIIEIQPDLSMSDVFQFLGDKGEPQQYSHALKNRVRTLKEKAQALLGPRLLYGVYKIDHISKASVEIQEDCRFKSPKLSNTLRPCEEIVCFIATVGTRIEKEINRLFEQNRLADAFVLDAVGSAAVENLVDQFQETIKEAMEEQEKTVTIRFSPGYCDWPVTEQKKLFKLLDSQDVELNDSCLMTPRKSISGVFGIQSDYENGDKAYNPCWDCNKTDCSARRAPERERKKI